MARKYNFKCRSEAQKRAIRAYYARKRSAVVKPKKGGRYKFKNVIQSRKVSAPRTEARERYWKVMAQDFPKDFISDDEWDYIESLATWPK